MICRDVVVIGSKVHDVPVVAAMPPGDARGYDVRTGQLLWQFRTVPEPKEFGHDTWDRGSTTTIGGANIWTLMSADDDLGYVYLPVTRPATFDRQGVTENDVIDFTPELRKEALAVLAKYNYGPLYTPPSLEKPTINMPGYATRASTNGWCRWATWTIHA